MQRLGAHSSKMRSLDPKDVFRSRLKLMIVMTKAYLNNYQLGGRRAAVIRNNARKLTEAVKDWDSYNDNAFGREGNRPVGNHLDHILFQRLRLLAVMAKSFAEGNPMGHHRKMALQNNIDYICESLRLENEPEPTTLLSVA